jgi:thiol-disulfide isomerase/thioredoxin
MPIAMVVPVHRIARAALAAIAAIAAIVVSVPAHAQDGGIAVGAHAPSAAVRSLDGKPIDLGGLVGTGPAVVEFWATWCPNCKELEPTMAAAASKYGGQVRFVTVAVAINESIDRVRKHIAAHPLAGAVVYDADGNAATAYDAPATSYVVVIDRAGRVVYTGVGGTQDIEAAIHKAI